MTLNNVPSCSIRRAHRAAGLPVVLVLGLGVIWTDASIRAARPPANRTYFTVSLGTEDPYSWRAGCLVFTESELCDSDGLCGSWHRTEAPGPQSSFTYEFDFEQDGVSVLIEGRGRIDDRGKGDSMFGVARGRVGRKTVNFGIAGRSTKDRTCSRLLREWSRDHPPPQPPQTPECLQRANFGHPAASRYILPYPEGEDYRISQTYCYLTGGHRDDLAYDFELPIGADVIAAREGTVIEVRDDLPDDGSGENPNENNQVFVRHDDDTAALYIHVQQGSIVVQVGERVSAGQRIAASGNAGWTGGLPHLHFAVKRPDNQSIPLSFRNAKGPLDERGGLINFVYYEALPE